MSKLSLSAIRDVSSAIRPLGSIEHAFLLLDKTMHTHFSLTAEVSGRTSVGDWRNALDRVQERHPLLSMTIGSAPSGVPWFRRVDGASIPMRVVYDDPHTRRMAEVSEESVRTIDPNHAPLVRAVLIHASDSAALTLVAHHSIADGMSVAYLLRDTLTALSKGILRTLLLPPAMEDAFRAGATSVPAVAEASEAPAVISGIWRPQDDARPHIQARRLGRSLSARLRDRVREESTTVQGALCAALAIAGRRAVAPFWSDIPVRIVSPVNIRRRREPLSMSNAV